MRFALVNFTGLSLVTRSPERWSLAGIPEHRDAFKIVPFHTCVSRIKFFTNFHKVETPGSRYAVMR